MFGFHTIKALLALLGADWGCQTGRQAQMKGRCWRQRLAHVGIVAAVQGLSAWTADVSWKSRARFVAINAITHFVIDSYRLPKVADQALHVAVVVSTAPLLKGEKRERS